MAVVKLNGTAIASLVKVNATAVASIAKINGETFTTGPGDIYDYSITVEIAGGRSATLTDFPVTIFLSASCGTNSHDATAIFDELGANKLKLAVYDQDDDQCYVEIERWDTSNEVAVLHTKIASIPTTGCELTLWYDSTAPDNSSNVGVVGSTPGQNVWNSAYVGVYHFTGTPDTGTGALLDSTSNGLDGNAANMEVGDVATSSAGKLGWEFGGVNEYAVVPDNATQSLVQDFTPELFYDSSNKSTAMEPFNKFSSGNTDGWGFRWATSGYPYIGYKRSNAVYTSYKDETLDQALGEHYFGFHYPGDGTTTTMTLDDADTTTDYTETNNGGGAKDYIDDSGQGLFFGKGNTFHSTTTYYIGKLFECRLSNAERTQEWRQTTYKTLSDNLCAIDPI
jgi:hypothetical protein